MIRTFRKARGIGVDLLPDWSMAMRKRNDGNLRGAGLKGLAVLIAGITGHAATAAPPAPCDQVLIVQLTPDVPDPRDGSFLSSLLSNHPDYQLTVLEQRKESVVVFELTGPGPDDACQDVIETMRRDGRVLSIHVQETD